jgi:hypothetical protein
MYSLTGANSRLYLPFLHEWLCVALQNVPVENHLLLFMDGIAAYQPV